MRFSNRCWLEYLLDLSPHFPNIGQGDAGFLTHQLLGVRFSKPASDGCGICLKCRGFFRTCFEFFWAPRSEGASFWEIAEERRLAGNCLEPVATGDGDRFEESLGVGVLPLFEHITHVAGFDDAAGVENADTVGN
jgi:hypothetical protein